MARLVCAYVAKNALPTSELSALILSVHEAFRTILAGEAGAHALPVPAVPVSKSVRETYIVCLEDGRPLKSLKRHLWRKYQLTPDAYRKRWGLAPTYPMVAPAYARLRSEIAKRSGLGRKPVVRRRASG